MQIKDKKLWASCVEKNKDPYSAECIKVAKAWAEKIEEYLSQDQELEVVAAKAFKEVDTGITGFMYGAVVATLAGTWEHGEKLRKWHNKDTSPKQAEKANAKAGCVLNPAVLIIGGEEPEP